MRKLALAIALLLAAGGAHAQKTFRCTDDKGKTYYTDKPDAKCKAVQGTPNVAIPQRPATKTVDAKPRTIPNRTKLMAPASPPPTQQAHCAAIAKSSDEIASGRTGGLDAAASAHRQAGLREAQQECR